MSAPLPFAQATDDELGRVRGVITDIDDTLTRAGELEVEAVQALHDLRADGLHVLAITGRPLGMVETLARVLPVSAAVGENGIGYFIREGRKLHPGYLMDEDQLEAGKAKIDALRDKVAAAFPQVRITKDDHLRKWDLAWDIGEEDHHDQATIDALSELIEAEGFLAVVSSIHSHAQLEPWNKATGAQGTLKIMGLTGDDEDWSRWLFIGDSKNDAPAFEFFPLTVGVANIEHHLARLPKQPRYITAGDRGKGFAEMAARVIAARAKAT